MATGAIRVWRSLAAGPTDWRASSASWSRSSSRSGPAKSGMAQDERPVRQRSAHSIGRRFRAGSASTPLRQRHRAFFHEPSVRRLSGPCEVVELSAGRPRRAFGRGTQAGLSATSQPAHSLDPLNVHVLAPLGPASACTPSATS
jgi:hypothetical protein